MTLVKTAIDAHAYQGSPATNYGSLVRLALNGTGGTDDRQAFIHFARPFPLGATVLSAKLRVYTRGAWASSQTLTAKRIVEKWAENLLTWNKRPAVVTTNSAALVVSGAADGQLLELDVTALMVDVANGAAYFGLRLELSANVLRQLHSAEAVNANLRPVLEVEWSTAPDAPSSLAPAGGRAISVTKPLLAWTYVDRDAGQQTSSQVQVSTSSDFTTPAYDSGKVANTEPTWDLAATAFSALADNVTRFWRVRVWDDDDVVSEWSDAVDFARQQKGVLTLTSPAGPTIDDLSPPVLWTFTGETQESYRVRLLEDVGGVWTQRYDSGQVVGTVLSHGIPEGLIVGGKSYRIELRVWDTLDRQAIALDPDYVEDTVDVTYSRSGAPVAVTALTATKTPNSHGPGVLLEWERSAAPDYFALMVDGVNVPGFERIDPGDVFVSGTTYAMTWWGATPRVSATFEIEAVVDSGGAKQHSDGNATAALTLTTSGIWLIDPDDDTAVEISGRDAVDFKIGESGETHFLRGRRDPVRITDTLRGYEGSVAGVLKGKTARDTFLDLKGRLKPVRLVISDLNILVELEAATAPPTALPNDRLFGCSFGFVQVGDFTFDVAGG